MLLEPSEIFVSGPQKISLMYLDGEIYRVNDTFKQFIEKNQQPRRQSKSAQSSNFISSLEIKSKKTLLPLNMLLEDSQCGIASMVSAVTLLAEEFDCAYDERNKRLRFGRNIWKEFGEKLGIPTYLIWQDTQVQFCIGLEYHRYGCQYFAGHNFVAALVDDMSLGDQSEEKYFLLCRYKAGSNPFSESNYEEDEQRADKACAAMTRLGSVPYVFMQVILSKEEFDRHSPNKPMTIVPHLHHLRFDKGRFELLGIVGVENHIDLDFKETVATLAESKTKLVFVSSESQAETQTLMNLLYEKEFPELVHLHPQSEYQNILEDTCRKFTRFADTERVVKPDNYIEFDVAVGTLPEDEGNDASRSSRIDNPQGISRLTRILPYVVVVDGRVFAEMVYNRKELEQLGFLVQFAQRTFFYNMTPKLKGDVVQFVREYQYVREKVTIACVASDYASRFMMCRSDCAVHLAKAPSVSPIPGYFDLVVTSLSTLAPMMSTHSQHKISIIWYMIRTIAYISVMHGGVQVPLVKVPYFMNNELFLLVLVNVANGFVFGLIMYEGVKKKKAAVEKEGSGIQWEDKHLNEAFKIDHHIDYLLTVFLKSVCDGIIVYGVTTHFYVWFEDFEMGMYTINQIYLIGVFTFRIVLSFPVTLKSLVLGLILFLESLLTYSFMRTTTLTSYGGFLGQLLTYKEVYI